MRMLQKAWCADTAVYPEAWSKENPATGQCAVTTLVLQDLLGGSIMRAEVGDGTHYWLRLDDGTDVDLTWSQFGDAEQPSICQERSRDQLLSNEDTARRYSILRERLGYR